MTLREQVEALPLIMADGYMTRDGTTLVPLQAVLDLIDAHRCIDPERLARALDVSDKWGNAKSVEAAAAAIAAAYEEQGA